MTLQLLAENLPSILADFPEIRLVYLFGSRVSGQIGPMSDYDLAIYTSKPNDVSEMNFETQVRFHYRLAQLLSTDRIDIVSLNRAPIELAYHIIADGKLLYQKDTFERVEFEAQVLSHYGDYLPVLRMFKDQILQGGAHVNRVQRYREALGRTQRTLGPPRTP